MINHRLFVKGEIIYALLTSNSHPNILIPVKVAVRDVKHDDVNPQYLVQVIKFYDDIRFLKDYLFNMSFSNKFDQRARKFPLKKNKFKSRDELTEFITGTNREKYYFVVDSIMTKKYRGDMVQLFNKVQDFLINVRFRDCRELMTRTFYSGMFKLTGEAEYEVRLRKFIGDKIEDTGMPIGKYFRLL